MYAFLAMKRRLHCMSCVESWRECSLLFTYSVKLHGMSVEEMIWNWNWNWREKVREPSLPGGRFESSSPGREGVDDSLSVGVDVSGMKKCSGAFVLLIFSSVILLNVVFLSFGGFGVMMRLGMPIGLRMVPLNEELMAWLDIPLPMALVARVKEVRPRPAMGGSVGGGDVVLEFDMKKWKDEDGHTSSRLTEAVFVQETADIEEIQHYKAVLAEVAFSSWNFFCWILIGLGVLAMGGGAVWKIVMRKSEEKELKVIPEQHSAQ